MIPSVTFAASKAPERLPEELTLAIEATLAGVAAARNEQRRKIVGAMAIFFKLLYIIRFVIISSYLPMVSKRSSIEPTTLSKILYISSGSCFSGI